MDSHDAFTHVRIARISLASARISSGASPPKSIVKLFRCQNLHFLLGWFPHSLSYYWKDTRLTVYIWQPFEARIIWTCRSGLQIKY